MVKGNTADRMGEIAHLQCASYEMPISLGDEKWFGTGLPALCDSSLLKDRDGWYHPHSNFLPYPAAHVSIRTF